MKTKELTAERLRELLDYDPETGTFRWKVSVNSRALAGDVAGSNHRYGRKLSGYRRIGIDGREYLAHRLAWLYAHGEWPPDEIDHKDGVTANTKIVNLRPATRRQNTANRHVTHSGLKGAYRCSKGTNWRAQITIEGKTIHLGHFETEEAAHAAYCKAANDYFGEFARAA